MTSCPLDDCNEKGCYGFCYDGNHRDCLSFWQYVQEVIDKANSEQDLDVKPKTTTIYTPPRDRVVRAGLIRIL